MKVNIRKFPKGSSDRKIDITIENFDTWNMDHTLALIILPMLIQLKETKHGIPNDFATVGGENYHEQLSFDFYAESHDDSFSDGCRRWEEALDKMIWSFQQIAIDDYDSLYHHGNIDFDFVATDKLYPNPVTGKMEKTYQMVDKNPNNHWYDHVGHKLHEERIQEGLDLFSKYYRALWD